MPLADSAALSVSTIGISSLLASCWPTSPERVALGRWLTAACVDRIINNDAPALAEALYVDVVVLGVAQGQLLSFAR